MTETSVPQESIPGRALPRPSHAYLYLVLLGVMLAAAGQYVLLKTNGDSPTLGAMQALGGGLLVLGAMAFGWGASRSALQMLSAGFDMGGVAPQRRPWYQPWPGLLLATASAIAAIALFAWRGETPIVVGLWITGILVLSLVQFWRVKLAWHGNLVTEWRYLAVLVVILVIALVTRTFHLATLAYNVSDDWCTLGLEARGLLTGQQPHIFVLGDSGGPIIGDLPAALSMRLFGDNLLGLRSSGVIGGLLSIVGIFLLGRELFHARVGVIAAALLTVSYAHLAASREVHIIDEIPLLIFSIYFLIMGLRQQRGWAIAASGIATAFCVQYFAARIIIPLLFCLMIYFVIFQRAALRQRGTWLLLWLLAFLITLGPMLAVSASKFNDMLAHSRQVSILNPQVIAHEEGAYHTSSVAGVLLEQARRSVLLFHYYVDTGTQFSFSRPFLDPITATLFTVGLGLAAFRFRRLGPSLLLAWIVLGVVLGSFVEENPPTWSRIMILLPPTALLGALALEVFYGLFDERFHQLGGLAWLVTPLALAVLLAWIGIRNWNTYVQVEGSYATPRTRISRYLADQPPSTRAFLVTSNEGVTYHDQVFRFLIPGRLVANLTADQLRMDVPRVGSPTILILTGEEQGLAQQLPALIPGGVLTTGGGNSPGEVAFYAYRLP